MKLVIPVLAALLLLTACGSDDNTDSPTPTPDSPSTTATPALSPTSTDASPTASAEASPTPNVTTPAFTPITRENFADLENIATVSIEAPQYMAWQPNGMLIVASNSQAIVITAASGASETVYTVSDDELIVAVSRQGQIATTPDRTSIEVRDLTGEVTATITPPGQFGSVDFSRDGTVLATTRRDEFAVEIWDTATGDLDQEVTGFTTAAPVYSAALGPDSEKLIWHARATVQITDLASRELMPAMNHELFLSGFDLSSESNRLVTTWGAFATLWDASTGERIEDLDQGTSALAPLFILDGSLLLIATDEDVKLWDAGTFEELTTLDAPARQIAVNAEASHLATIDQSGLVTIWTPPMP